MGRILSRLAALGLLALSATSPVGAAIISGNDAVFGLDSIAIDTDTTLEWLDPTFSVSRTFADVATQFGPGGDFEGFRHASGSEIAEFWGNANITGIDTTFLAANFGPVTSLTGLMGLTSGGSLPYLDAFYADVRVPGERYRAVLTLCDFPTCGAFGEDRAMAATTQNWQTETFAVPQIGHWLVRGTHVPEPDTLPLLLSGLAGLAWHRRRGSLESGS